MQTQITLRCVIEEETEELGEKPLRRPPSGNRSIRKSVVIHGLTKDPPSLIYPMYLSPLSSYSNKASQNRVLSSSPDLATSSILHLPSLASSNASQQLQKHLLHSEKVWIVTKLLRTVSCLALRILQQAPYCICHHWLLPMLPSNSKNTYYTLKRCGLCLGTNLFSRYDNGKGMEKILQWFLTKDE